MKERACAALIAIANGTRSPINRASHPVCMVATSTCATSVACARIITRLSTSWVSPKTLPTLMAGHAATSVELRWHTLRGTRATLGAISVITRSVIAASPSPKT